MSNAVSVHLSPSPVHGLHCEWGTRSWDNEQRVWTSCLQKRSSVRNLRICYLVTRISEEMEMYAGEHVLQMWVESGASSRDLVADHSPWRCFWASWGCKKKRLSVLYAAHASHSGSGRLLLEVSWCVHHPLTDCPLLIGDILKHAYFVVFLFIFIWLLHPWINTLKVIVWPLPHTTLLNIPPWKENDPDPER